MLTINRKIVKEIDSPQIVETPIAFRDGLLNSVIIITDERLITVYSSGAISIVGKETCLFETCVADAVLQEPYDIERAIRDYLTVLAANRLFAENIISKEHA